MNIKDSSNWILASIPDNISDLISYHISGSPPPVFKKGSLIPRDKNVVKLPSAKTIVKDKSLNGLQAKIESYSSQRLLPEVPMLEGRIPDGLLEVQTKETRCSFKFELDIPSHRFAFQTKNPDRIVDKTYEKALTIIELPLPKLEVKITFKKSSDKWFLQSAQLYHPRKNRQVYIPLPNIVPFETNICYGSALDKYNYPVKSWNDVSNLINIYFQSKANFDYIPVEFSKLKNSPWSNLTKEDAQKLIEEYPKLFWDVRMPKTLIDSYLRDYKLLAKSNGYHLIVSRLDLLVWSKMPREEFLTWVDKLKAI